MRFVIALYMQILVETEIYGDDHGIKVDITLLHRYKMISTHTHVCKQYKAARWKRRLTELNLNYPISTIEL